MITDRDIAVRGVAAGKGPETPMREVMWVEVKYYFEDQTVEEVTAHEGITTHDLQRLQRAFDCINSWRHR